MPSQFLEWLPWNFGLAETVPDDATQQREFVRKTFLQRDEAVAELYRETLLRQYGRERGAAVRCAEAFQLCEYGSRPSPEELRKLFPHVS